MATQQEGGSHNLVCPGCGASLQPDLEDQFFCEYCGASLPRQAPTWDVADRPAAESPEPPEEQGVEELPDWLRPVEETPARQQGVEELPDWLQPVEETPARQQGTEESPAWLEEMAAVTSYEGDAQPERIELRPTRKPPPTRDVPKRRPSQGCVPLLVITLLLGVLFLAGWIVFALFATQPPKVAPGRRRGQEVVVSPQEYWASTGIRVRAGQLVTIVYRDGTWGVWGGPRGGERQVGPEGYAGEYRAVGPPLPSMPIGALLGRIGEGQPFPVGREVQYKAEQSGVLRLMINDQWLDDNTGALLVEVSVESP